MRRSTASSRVRPRRTCSPGGAATDRHPRGVTRRRHRVDRPGDGAPQALDRRPRTPARHGRAHAHRPRLDVHDKPALERQLVAMIAGVAGERVAFGHLSTGVNDDLHAATQLARRMVTSFGMSDALGPVTIGESGGEVFLGASLQDLGGRPVDARSDRPRGRAIRRRRRGASGARAPGQLALRPGDRERAAHARDALWRGARRCALDGRPDRSERAARDHARRDGTDSETERKS